MPRVSVIVPAHNAAGALPEALGSVGSQTSDDWEVIVGDDASTDDTVAVAEGFGKRVRVVQSQERLGPAHARNLAIAAASGELLAFLDADDYWLPEYLAEQVALYDRSQEQKDGVGIVACDALVRHRNGFAEGTYRDRVPFPDSLTLATLLASNPVFISALVPRAVLDETGGFSTDCFGTEDYDLWIRVIERGYRAVANPKALAVYRIGEPSVSASVASMTRNIQTVYRRALERDRLGRRERWIARRELRLQRLVEKVAEVQEGRESSGRRGPRERPAIALRAIGVAIENPQRWVRVSSRLLRGPGTLRQRLIPGWDAVIR
jgi:teichuronic acid biosynthesis glycosyltransferase TuaG